MREGERNTRELEQMILWVYSLFTVVLAAAVITLGWELLIVPLLIVGMASCWWCVVTQYRGFRFRAFWVMAMCLLNYMIYGMKEQDFFHMLISMAAVFFLLALYGLPEILGITAGFFGLLLVYHLLIGHSFTWPDSAEEAYVMLLQFISLLTVEGLVYYSLKKQKEIQRQLSETIETLKKAQKSKDDFLANVSHEIRTPISTICGISDVLRMEPLPDKVHESVADIHMAGQHLLAAVSDILDFTELQLGKLTIAEEPYDLASTLNDVMNMSMAKNEKGLDIRLECEGDIPSSMLGDEQKIKRVMLNLMDNAIKFTEKGSVRIRVQARKEAYGANLCVSVRDTGIGIEPQQVETLFQIFNQADTNSNRRTEGIGLGLIISQKLVHQMRGFMSVKSEFGRGSEFQFVIPQQVLDATPIHSMDFGKSGVSRNSFTAPDCRILAVDDNVMNLKVITGLLAPYRIQTDTAQSGEEALKKMKEQIFDFLFMDQMMPGMDGIETLHRIRRVSDEYHQNVPVIALTANAVGGAREMFLSEGFQDYLTKPVDLSDLNRVLKKYVPHYKKIEITEKKKEKLSTEPGGENRRKLPAELDTKAGIAYCGGSWEDYLEILDIYIDNGASTLNKLQNFYGQEDWENYTILVHSLKSNSRGIGAEALSRLAEEQERNGKEKNTAAIRTLHAPMLQGYHALLEKLRRERAERKGVQEEAGEEPEVLTELSDGELKQALVTLREKLDAFESDEIEELLTDISHYSFRGKALRSQMETIFRKAKAFDYPGAEEALDEWEEGNRQS